MPDRFEMNGIVIVRAGENEDGNPIYDLNSAPSPGVEERGISVLVLLARLGGRRRHSNVGTPAFREALCFFLGENPRERILCHFCGNEAIGLHRYFIPYCDEHSEFPFFCSDCSEWIQSDDFNEEADMCVSCSDARSVECNECGETTEDYENIDGDLYCRRCYENMRRCSNCGSRLDRDEEEDYCSQCSRQNVPIHEANARVVDVLRSQRYGEIAKDQVYFGVELEVEVSGTENDPSLFTNAANGILNALGRDFIMLKSDGSLGEGGMEINTLPCTLKVQKEKWDGFFNNKPSGLTSWKNNRCGIHIHITRKPLGMLTIGKMTVFLNDPENETFITQIAGRYNHSYAKMKPKKITDTNGEDRYEMLNLTSSKTVEMRIFKGTLNKVHFMADLEFAQALVHFCRTTSIRFLNTPKFMQFLRVNRKDYPNLFTFSCKEEKGEDV